MVEARGKDAVQGQHYELFGADKRLLQGQQGKPLINTMLWASKTTHKAKGRPWESRA